MRARLCNLLLSVVVLAVLPLGASFSGATASGALADCPTGTHWDVITQTCQ
jgi:hypothetical protein